MNDYGTEGQVLFQEGDIVIVKFTRNDLFPFQTDCGVCAKIMRFPQDTGDSYVFQHNEWTFTVNPNCSAYVGVIKKELEK